MQTCRSYWAVLLGLSRQCFYESVGSLANCFAKLQAVNLNSTLIAQMEINKIFEKKGHEFIDVVVGLFDQHDEACVMTINLTAIYKLRGS